MSDPIMPRVGGSFTLDQLEKIAFIQAGQTVPTELAGVQLPDGFADPGGSQQQQQQGDGGQQNQGS